MEKEQQKNTIFNGTTEQALVFIQENLGKVERLTPGSMIMNGIDFHFVDFHSFGHEFIQIFGNNNYGVESAGQIDKIIDCGAHVGLASIYYALIFPTA